MTLIVLGTLLRGPNWNFFGPYETWDAHKVEALNNINLSEYFWQWWLGRSVAAGADTDSSVLWLQLVAHHLTRELPGILLVLGYFIALPPILAITVFRDFYQADGIHPLHGVGQLAAVHGGAADQDGFAMVV